MLSLRGPHHLGGLLSLAALLAIPGISRVRAQSADDGRAAARAAVARFDLTAQTLNAWRDHILPTADELAWEKIAWLPTFKDGLLRAGAERRPLLLWVMNGHPLGCT